MPNDAPLLSIAIPTYSRAHFLEGLLTALFEQLKDETRVELLISDNASTDRTGEVVAGFQDRGLAIRYILNETNLGADKNILQCYLQASGKYVWVFSDDDLILPGTIKRVLNALSLGVYDIVTVAACSLGEEEASRQKHGAPLRDWDFKRAEDFARSTHVMFTFISGLIVHKERISSMPHRPFESLVDTNLVQLGPFYSALNQHRRSLMIRDVVISVRGNTNVGYALYRVFGTNFERITREWVDRAPVRDAILNGTIRRFFPYWLMLSRESRASSVPEEPHHVLRKCYGNNMRYWIFDYPIYALPLPLAKLWLLGVRIVNKLDLVIGGLLSRP